MSRDHRKFAGLRLGVIATLPICAAVLIGLSVRRASSVESKAVAAPADEFAGKIVPFVAKYCSDCHAGAKPEGNLDLTKFKDASAVASNRKTWRKVLGKLAAHEMPPADEDQPSDDERNAVVRWIDAELARPVPISAQDPGRVTIHRLNRTEYNNTIRDLVGVDFHPADDFPADDVGYGFDNIGDVLSMSPLLLEKYMARRRANHGPSDCRAAAQRRATDKDIRRGKTRCDGPGRVDLPRRAADRQERRAAAEMECALRRRLSAAGSSPRREIGGRRAAHGRQGRRQGDQGVRREGRPDAPGIV